MDTTNLVLISLLMLSVLMNLYMILSKTDEGMRNKPKPKKGSL